MSKLMIKGQQASGTYGNASDIKINEISGLTASNAQEALVALNNSLTKLGTVYSCSGQSANVEANGIINSITITEAGRYLLIAIDKNQDNGFGGIGHNNTVAMGMSYCDVVDSYTVNFVNMASATKYYYNDSRYFKLYAIKIR